jgi:hypothetical protein
MSFNNSPSNNDDYNKRSDVFHRIKEERIQSSLKSVSNSQLEETISKALSELLNYPYKVKIEYINFSDIPTWPHGGKDDGSELKLIVYQEEYKVYQEEYKRIEENIEE